MLFLGWLIGALLVGWLGSSRKTGFGMAFLWSLLLSPLIGVIITASSKSLEDAELESMQLDLQKKQTEELKSIKEVSAKTLTQQIKEAKELLDNGIITDEEFAKLKKKALGD